MGQVIYNFFWWLAGANRKILKEHIVDHDKYFQIGVAVLITALMAAFTGGFAFHYASNKGFTGDVSLFTIIASIFWGFIILNLDRFLVLSMQKQGSSLVHPTTYEKFQNFMGEFIFAVPRILLAILIAKVILVPLELYLFKDQISNQIPIVIEQEKEEFTKLKRDEQAKLQNIFEQEKESAKDKYINLLEPLKQERDNLQVKLNKLQKKISSPILKILLEQKEEKIKDVNHYVNLRDFELRTGRGEGYYSADSNYTKSRSELSKIEDKINTEMDNLSKISSENVLKFPKLESALELVKNKIKIFEKEKSEELDSIHKSYAENLKILNQERSQYENSYEEENIMLALKAKDSLFKNDSGYDGVHFLLTLLLITIELLPLIVKLLLSRSSYDAHIQRISNEESIKHDAFIRDEKLKYQMLFKSLRLRKNIEYETLDKELKKAKFSSNE